MSRTDKDAPYWVRTEWFEPFHYCGWRKRHKYRTVEKTHVSKYGFKYNYNVREVVKTYYEYVGDCDLPAEPIRENTSVRWRARKGQKARCVWEAVWPEEERHVQMRGRRKKFWRHSEFYGPQRAAVRDAAREVIKGNHEVEFPDGRHRHSVLWDW